MSGLFERLVARSAASAAPALRPRTDSAWRDRNAPQAQPALPSTPLASRTTSTVAPIEGTVASAPMRPSDPAPALASSRPDTRVPDSAMAPGRHALPTPARFDEPAAPVASIVPAPLAPRSAPVEPDPPGHEPPLARSTTDGSESGPRVLRARVPAPLLAPVPIPRSSATAPVIAPMPGREPALPATAPAPDVHIHIGRIELSAVVPATGETRPAPARSAPAVTSLEDYLMGRRGLGA